MYEQINPLRIKLALSNPHLGFDYRSFDSSAVVPILITVRGGAWDLETPDPSVNRVDFTDSTSTFRFDSFDGMPLEVILVKSDLSISEIENNIELYPNPAQSEIFIRSEVPIYNARIIDAAGKSINITIQNNRIDVENLAPGIYFLELETTAGIVIGRFTKI
jgi:chondroitin-sulfate-ABC endolyase/exolyase